MAQPELERSLGLTSAIAIVVGGVIGSGIFLKPYDIARSLPGPAWIFACWIGLGVICLFGAFVYAELGALLPEAGGQYAFLREAWGRFPAFLYGWCLFLVINTGTLAALAVAFASSLGSVVALSGTGETAVAAAMILVLALVNHFGAGAGAGLQNLSTLAKLGALAAIVLGGFLVAPRATTEAARAAPELPDLTSGLVVSALAIFWAYQGWYQLPFNAAELRDPERTLPRGLILGTLVLIAVYVSVNAAYLRAVPLEEMRTLQRDVDVPLVAIERMLGGPSESALALLLCLSAFGAANPCLLSTPRAFYAMAQDGLWLRSMTRVHPTHRTPTIAIWSQAAWSVGLVVVLQQFRDLTEFVVFAALLFYALTVAAVFVLRRKLSQRPRPYACWGYPWAPAVFIGVVLLVDVRTLMDPVSRRNSLLGLLILAAGALAYATARWRARRA